MIRHIILDDIYWFVAIDILAILEMKKDCANIKKVLDINKRKSLINTNGGKQKLWTININGIKQLLLSSRSIKNSLLCNILYEKHNINMNLDIKYTCTETSYLRILTSVFRDHNYKLQFTTDIFPYKIDLYFINFKIAIEVDEFGHKGYYIEKEDKREQFIINKLNCTFIRFNPDKKDFNIGDIIYTLTNIFNKEIC